MSAKRKRKTKGIGNAGSNGARLACIRVPAGNNTGSCRAVYWQSKGSFLRSDPGPVRRLALNPTLKLPDRTAVDLVLHRELLRGIDG